MAGKDGAKAKPGLHDQELKAVPQGEAFSFAVNPAKEKLFLGVFLGALSALAVQHSCPLNGYTQVMLSCP